MVTELWPGVRAVWSRRVNVPSTAAADPDGSTHTWHLLDNGPQLEERGITRKKTERGVGLVGVKVAGKAAAASGPGIFAQD